MGRSLLELARWYRDRASKDLDECETAARIWSYLADAEAKADADFDLLTSRILETLENDRASAVPDSSDRGAQGRDP